jgi:hypothetical protein
MYNLVLNAPISSALVIKSVQIIISAHLQKEYSVWLWR